MGRLSNLRIVDPVLTNVALGYTNNEFVGQYLMPYVWVERTTSKLPVFGKEAFKIYNTERALRAKSNRIQPEGIGSIDLTTDEHDIEYPIDYLEAEEAAFPLETWATTVVQGVIALRREKMIADMAQNAANFGGNSITLSGTSQFTNAASTPLDVFEDAKEGIRKKIGKRPNTAVIGASSLRSLRFHAQITDKLKYTSRGVVRLEALRDLLEIENIYVGEGIYSDDAGNFADLWSDNIVLAYVPAESKQQGVERNAYDPSFGYTPRRRGMPQVDVRAEDGKLELVRSTDNFRPYITAATAGYLIADTNG
ncbi:hypothetical protein CKO44_07750 [Rubrivivax gelatinosus]|uniref:major capsid protein n=1 Tax=Rubrivivax gelatinosus TaxID=28068 RepID=UPI0019076686|nr:hypothetical protein [Rubrivivax gelatinosus]MBK1613362.1 hypothetical protein [Rubrivivax gelatinosus]